MAVWRLPPLPPKVVAPVVVTPNVSIDGAEDLLAKLQLLPQLSTASVMNGMLDKSQEVMDWIKANGFVPFQFGPLQESGAVYVSETDTDPTIIMSFGGVGSGVEAYALDQHENLSYNHPIQGGPKYLERPLLMRANDIIAAGGQSLSIQLEKNSSGWASGDWKTVVPIRDRPPGSVVKEHTRGGKTIKPYFRKTRGK